LSSLSGIASPEVNELGRHYTPIHGRGVDGAERYDRYHRAVVPVDYLNCGSWA